MREQIIDNLINIHTPKPLQNVWEFAEANVDFSTVMYDTPLKTKYNPNYLNIYKEMQECITDRSIRQIHCLKSARSGWSENVALNALRYKIGYAPSHTMWITSTQQLAEQFYKERIIPALQMTNHCKQQLEQARETEHNVVFPSCSFTLAWSKGKAFGKAIGVECLICDEVSTFDPKMIPVFFKRTDTYPFHKIITGSSPDVNNNPDTDPVFQLFESGDMRYFFCNDGISDFKFEMGNPKTKYGLKWDGPNVKDEKTGEYNLNLVKKYARYVTPNGVIIRPNDMQSYIQQGKWKPTNANALEGIRSYHVNAFLIPFLGLGEIACAFLEAKKNDTIKGFWNEWMAEKHYPKGSKTDISQLHVLESTYGKGTLPSKMLPELKDKPAIRFMHTDVQGNSFWSLQAEVCNNNIYIYDYLHSYSFSDVDNFFKKYQDITGKPKSHSWSMDAGYNPQDVKGWAFTHKLRPVFGREQTTSKISTYLCDPYEGNVYQHSKTPKIRAFNVSPTFFKDIANNFLNGQFENKLFLYADAELELCKQLTSEKKKAVNGKLSWVKYRKDNHLWDCLYNIIAQATYYNALRIKGIDYSQLISNNNETSDSGAYEGSASAEAGEYEEGSASAEE